MAFAAKQEVTESSQPRRFTVPDFNTYGMWIISRLKAKFPTMTDKTALGWLRGLMESNEYYFVTNEKAVLLAQMVHAGLDPAPKVREIFCLCQDGQMQAGADLYRSLAGWAKNIGTDEIIVMRLTDVSKPMIEEALGGKVASRTLNYVRLA